MKRSTILQLLIHALVIFLILCVALLPVASVAIAGEIANANGCQLDEGSVHPCVVNGQDIGETLYSMGVMGWFMLVTLPIGAVLIVAYIFLVSLFYLVRWLILRRRATAPSA